ncbi:MAG: alpha/beta hydrolase [archaeon]
MKAFIIHGAYGSSKENWIPWLRKNLSKLGIDVVVPDFPTPQGQTIDIWMHMIDAHIKKLDEGAIFIGHSVGCAFILSILEKLKTPAVGCYFVAGWSGPLGKEIDTLNKSIADRNFNWVKIKSNSRKFVMFASNNDSWVPIEKSKELIGKLSGELVEILDGGHFNTSSGYTEFKPLLEKIIETVKK